jgi:soluble lytic murein transglycosylase-like protein
MPVPSQKAPRTKKEAIPPLLLRWNPFVKESAEHFDLDANLLLALIWTESEGDPTACRPEPRFVWFYQPEVGPLHRNGLSVQANRELARRVLGEKEFTFQSASHGLCQVMGAVAREMGFVAEPETLYNPEVNIGYGAECLATHLHRTRGDVTKALLRYNGGANPQYPVKVQERWERLKHEPV